MNKKELVVLTLLIFIIPLIAQQMPIDARLRGGRIHFQGARYEKALEQFSLALKDYPTSAEARFWKAQALEKLGRYVESAANLDTTFTKAPEWLAKTKQDEAYQYSVWNAFIKAGQQMDKENNFKDAILFYRRSTEVNPPNPQGYLLLSQIYTTMDSLDAIKNVANQLFAIDPKNQQVNVLIGIFFFKKENWDSAIVYYTKAASGFLADWEAMASSVGKELKLDSIQARIVASKLVEKRTNRTLESYINDSLKAQSKFMIISKLTDPLTIDEAELNIANYRCGTAVLQKVNSTQVESIQKKELNTAANYFMQALIYNPMDFDSRYNLGMTYYRAGLDTKAESTFRYLVGMSLVPISTFPEELSERILGLITKENLASGHIELKEKIFEDVDKALAQKSTFTTGFWDLYFWDLKKATQLPTKVDNDKIFVSSLASDAIENLYLLLGATQVDLKKYDNAIKSFNTVIAINPNNLDAYRNLAVCYREKGDKEKSYEIFQQYDKLKKEQK
jgi:tetratricopeptide (TPR) repeat protein